MFFPVFWFFYVFDVHHNFYQCFCTRTLQYTEVDFFLNTLYDHSTYWEWNAPCFDYFLPVPGFADWRTTGWIEINKTSNMVCCNKQWQREIRLLLIVDQMPDWLGLTYKHKLIPSRESYHTYFLPYNLYPANPEGSRFLVSLACYLYCWHTHQA